MSTFRAPVSRVRGFEPIRKADSIELAIVGDFRTVVRKGQFSEGDLVAYLPEAAIVPEWLLRRIGLWDEFSGLAGKGLLAGPDGTRIQVKRLRGCISEGIAYPVGSDGKMRLAPGEGSLAVSEGDDVAEALGLAKYSPPVPKELLGTAVSLPDNTLRFDIENRKAFPDVILEGEPVVYTEKIHGHFCAIGIIPGLGHPELFHGGDVFVASKQLYADRVVFKNHPDNEANLYVKGLKLLEAQVKAVMAATSCLSSPLHGQPVHILGELYGAGSRQKLKYGEGILRFRAFDVWVGTLARGRFLDVREKYSLLEGFGFDTVTVLYTGPHSAAEMVKHRDGPTVTGNGVHIREGIVITPFTERWDSMAGRVCFKEISPAYSGTTDGEELN